MDTFLLDFEADWTWQDISYERIESRIMGMMCFWTFLYILKATEAYQTLTEKEESNSFVKSYSCYISFDQDVDGNNLSWSFRLSF